MLVARPKAELDERARVGNDFGLPSIVGLVALHGLLRGVIPYAGWRTLKIMFADQGFLNIAGTLGIDLLLSPPPARLARFLGLA